MPVFKIIPQNGGIIGIWQLTETLEDLLPQVSPEVLKDPAYLQYTFEKRKIEWLATRLLIKQLIGANFTISYSEFGRPILNHIQFNHLSISHSRENVAVFVHENLHAGIDIENISRNYSSVEKKYLSDEELMQVNHNPFLQCLYWCAKEAIFKLVPDDGIEFRQQIHISPFNPEKENQFTAKFISGNIESIYKLQYYTFDDQCLVWVTN
ncbi:MAG: 4'-phosphopantetheinyl transferase superfamily protein [Prolixibacteraceae bacterium]|jgi:phosphopantetheinyl transferase